MKLMYPDKNKKAEAMVANYSRWAFGSTINTIYSKPCKGNVKAYNRLREEMICSHGHDFRCGNPTCHSWSCAYQMDDGINTVLVYHTRENTYHIYLHPTNNKEQA